VGSTVILGGVRCDFWNPAGKLFVGELKEVFPMIDKRNRSRILVASAFGLPIGIFAAYVAWLVVPEVLRVVVPSVVRSVVTQ
jgi:hypothetical protein